MVDESGNPRIWNDTVWMAVCMRSVWHPDGAGQLCVYAENQPEDYPTTQGAYYFARLVEERSGGRIRIQDC